MLTPSTAAASPSSVLHRISSRSYSAKTAKIPKISLLFGVVVSIKGSCSERNWAPLLSIKEREKKNTFKLNEEIQNAVCGSGSVEILRPDFEHCCGVSTTEAKQKGKALAALDHFSSKKLDDIPKVLANAVRLIYKCS